MLTIKQLDHVVLRVTDLAAMMHFYTEVIGCPVEKIQENLGLYQLRAGSSLIDLVPINFARQHKLLPLSQTADAIRVAIANPLDLSPLDDLRALSGKRCETVVASADVHAHA